MLCAGLMYDVPDPYTKEIRHINHYRHTNFRLRRRAMSRFMWVVDCTNTNLSWWHTLSNCVENAWPKHGYTSSMFETGSIIIHHLLRKLKVTKGQWRPYAIPEVGRPTYPKKELARPGTPPFIRAFHVFLVT